MRLLQFSLILLLFVSINIGNSQTHRRMYFIGNSVTDAMNYEAFKSIITSRGNTYALGSKRIPGSPLSFHLANPESGFTDSPYGYPSNAFPVYTWDYLSLQPFDRDIEGAEGDRASIGNYYNQIKQKSPDCKVLIYAHWPRTPNGKDYTICTVDDYNTVWLGTGIESRKFNEDLTQAVRLDFPATKDNIIMAPIGEVFYSLNNNTEFLAAAGISSIWGVYSDGIHMNSIGSYITSCVIYAMCYQDDPAGLGIPGNLSGIPNDCLAYIHQTIKEVIVAKSEFTKISYFGPAPVLSVKLDVENLELNTGKSATLTPIFTPSNAANKNVSWNSSNTSVATVTNGTVNALTAGTSDIRVTTEDGSKQYVCKLTVVNTGTAVTGISLNKATVSLLENNSEQLVATIEPSNASNKNIIWSSSDTSIAKVNNSGLVSAIKKGTASISAISVNGLYKATAVFTITRLNNPPVAVLKYTPGNAGYAPFKVTFDGRSSTDPDPGDFVQGYDWVLKKQGASTNIRVEVSNLFDHTFTEAGIYEVTLQAVDNEEFLRSLNTEKVIITIQDMPQVSVDEPALCYEGFDYLKAPINNFNGGRGWRSGWSVQSETSNTINDLAVDNTSPFYVTDLRQSGNYMILGEGYGGIGRSLDIDSNGAFKDYISGGKIGKAGTTLWFSVIIKPTSNNKDCYVSFSDESISWLNNTAKSHLLSFGSFGGPNWGFAIGHDANRAVTQSTVSVVNNTPAFIVGKVEFNATNNISVYINPAPGLSPNVTAITGTTSNSLLFQALSANFSSGSLKMAMDEIRFGKSYADVAPYFKSTDLTISENDNIDIYPNPAQQFINIAVWDENSNISIVSSQGIIFISKAVNTKGIQTVDVSNLAPGMYFVKIVSEKKQAVKLMLKE